jgi:hypothetical protein
LLGSLGNFNVAFLFYCIDYTSVLQCDI